MNLQPQNVVSEWVFRAEARYRDPGNEVCWTRVHHAATSGASHPGLSGTGEPVAVRIRLSVVGRTASHRLSNFADSGLHGHEGRSPSSSYEGDNPCSQHGPVPRRPIGGIWSHDGHPSSGWRYLVDGGLSSALTGRRVFRPWPWTGSPGFQRHQIVAGFPDSSL